MNLPYVRVQIILFGESLGALIAAMQEIVERPLVAGLLALVDEQMTAVAHLPHELAADLALNWHQHICDYFSFYPRNVSISGALGLKIDLFRNLPKKIWMPSLFFLLAQSGLALRPLTLDCLHHALLIMCSDLVVVEW